MIISNKLIGRCKKFELISKKTSQCNIFSKISKVFKHKYDQTLYREIRNKLLKKNDLKLIGKLLFDKSLKELDENGFRHFNLIIEMLKQSSCLDYHESSYLLSIIYSYGITIEPNNAKVKFLAY